MAKPLIVRKIWHLSLFESNFGAVIIIHGPLGGRPMIVNEMSGFRASRQPFALVLALVLGGCGSTPIDTPEPVATLEVNEAGEYVFEDEGWRDEVVCKRQRTSGSHVSRKVCKTRGEIEDEREAAFDVVGSLGPVAQPIRSAGDEPR